MPKVINRAVKHTNVAAINALRAYMSARTEATFDALRMDVPVLVNYSDGELRQAIQDSDLETHED